MNLKDYALEVPVLQFYQNTTLKDLLTFLVLHIN